MSQKTHRLAASAPVSGAGLSRPALSVRVRPLPLAAALAMGAHGPWVEAQTVITPIVGPGATQTAVSSSQPGLHTVTTATVRDGNAFNHLSVLKVGQGDTVDLVVPQGANWLVNLVRDARVQVDGHLKGKLADGSAGGNLLFIDSHGFAVGASGRVSGGRLVFAAPSTSFVDRLLGEGAGQSAASVNGVLNGQFERSATGAVRIDGVVQASEGVQIMAGEGGEGAEPGAAVSVNGRIQVNGRTAGSAVNLGDLRTLAPLVERDGVIDITTPGDILLNGKLLADGSHWSGAGAVRVVAGSDIAVGPQAYVSASAGLGTGDRGGQVALFAHQDIANTPGATLRARGDGAGAGGAIEYSSVKKLALDGMVFDAGSDSGAGGLVFIDPEDAELVSQNQIMGGADFVLAASQSVTVRSGVVINTRKVASGQDATDSSVVSTGDSGHIVLTAPNITIESGALLDASVVNAPGTAHAAGDITLTAEKSSDWVTLLGLADADAAIDVAGTLKGRNITLQASSTASAVYDGVSAGLTEKALSLLGDHFDSPLAFSLAYTEATGDATVRLRSTAQLSATDDLTITATADRSAGAELQVEGSTAANLGAGFSRVAGTTAIDIDAGASLTAGGDIALVAASKTSISMTSAAAGETDEETGAANVASVVFAGSLSDVVTRVNVAAGATLDSGGDTDLQAFHAGQYETSAEVTVYGNGTAGAVGALSLQKSDTSATLGGTATSDGAVRVMAMNASAMNSISASAEVAQTAPEDPPLELPPSVPTSEEAQQKLQLGFLAMAEELSAEAETASGGSSSAASKPPALKLAGALTWSSSDHSTRASIGPGARVSAAGDAVVDAQTLVGRLQGAALSEAASDTDGAEASALAVSVAINYAQHAFSTRAEVGANADIDAAHVAVNASTDIPEFFTAGLPLDWSSFSQAYANLVGGTDFLMEGFNTRVGSTAAGKTLAAAGAVNLTFMDNDTRAWVDTGAQISTTATDGAAWAYTVREVGFDSDLEPMPDPLAPYVLDKDLGVLGDFVSDTRDAPSGPDLDEIRFSRTQSGATVVRATTQVQTLHHAGGDGSEAGGSGGSVGGTFSMVDRSNTTVAGIADRAEVQTQRLEVNAQTTDWLVTIAPTSGQGAGMAANGIATYNQLDETTHASISREALVTAPSVQVDAQLSVGVIAITGAVTRSENSGVGIGLAINDTTGSTRAYVGDNDTDGGGADTEEGAAGSIQSGALSVRARSEGMVVALGVAGATAGEDPPPEEPADPADAPVEPPKSTAENLAGKVGTDAADAQAQIDGSDTTTAPVEEAAEPAKGEGTDAAAASDTEANKPPKFSIAGAGAIVTNVSDIDTEALVDRAVLSGIGAGTQTVAVQALSDLTQVSVAGGGALSLSKNASTTFTAAIAGAVAIQDSDDDTTARITGSTLTDLADQSDALVLQALKSGERTAVATGISANLSKGSTTSLSLVGSASVTTSTDDTKALLENSDVSGDALSPTALGVQVVAYDRSRTGAGGGALSVSTGKGASGVGAAISIVNAKGSTQAKMSDGSLTRAHNLAVLALSSQKVVGVGAVAGAQTNSDSTSLGQLMGAFVYNHVGNSLNAGVSDGAEVTLTGDLAVQAGGAPTSATLDALMGAVRDSDVMDYSLSSTGSGFRSAVGGESVVGVAGTLSATLGGNSSSLGLSYVHNDIQTTYGAELNGNITATGAVSVTALSQADIVGVSAGVGATKGKFSGMGSASVNLIGQRTQAVVSGGSVQASGLEVRAESDGSTFALAGNVSLAGGSGSAGGAAVAYTQTGAKTYTLDNGTLSTRASGNEAAIRSARVDVLSGSVNVLANNTSDIRSVAASGAAAAGNKGFAGTVTVNEMGDNTSVLVDDTLLTAGQVTVSAGESASGRTSSIQSLAGGLAASSGYSGALALGYNTISNVRRAHVSASNLIVGNSVTVQAHAQGAIKTVSATLAGGKDYAAAGSFSINTLNADISATYDGGGNSLRGLASSVKVLASGSGDIQSLAGAVSGAGNSAIGGALAINSVGEDSAAFSVKATLSNIELLAPVAVQVDATLAGSIGSVAASGGGAGTNAINGSVSTNTIDAEVQALVSGVTQTQTGGSLGVHAVNDADIDALAGTVSGAGTTSVGAAISVNMIGGHTRARLADSILRASGAVEVDATTSGTIHSAASGASGAGTTAAAGSNTTNAITSTVLAQVDSVTQAVSSPSLRVQARDSATIQSFAGAVAGSGANAGGAAFALNFLGRTATNADSSKQVRAEVIDSQLRSSGAVNVKALSTSTIESLGLALGGGGAAAVTGSNTTNLLEDEISASWSGGSLNGTPTTLTVQADDAATVHTLAGNVSGSAAGAFGAAIAVNQIGSAVSAGLSGVTLGAAVSTVVDAGLSGEIKSVAASGAADGAASVNGSFTTNALSASVKAQVQGVNQTASGGAFTVSADNDADIFSLAGTVSGSGGAAVGAAVAVNEIGGDVTAQLKQSTLRATGAVDVLATSSGTVQSVAAGLAGGGTVALSGSNTTNAITSTVLAQMDGVTQAVSSASLRVQALDSSTLQSFAGSVAGSGGATGGAAFALNFLGRTATNADSSKQVRAEVIDSQLRSSGAVNVKALSTSTIESLGLALGGGGAAAVTGSNTTNLLEDEISASWSGGSLNGTPTTLTVQADDAATVRTLAGNVSGSTAGAFGAAIAVNQVGSAVSAGLSGVTLGAAVSTVVDAGLSGEIKSVAASGAADGAAAVNGSFTTNALSASVKAQVQGVNQTASGGAFTVSADNDADIFSLAGTVSGSGGAAVGAAVAVNEIGGDVTAQLSDSRLRATGAVDVLATSSGTVQSVAAGMAGGGTVALSGSNTTNAITSTVLAQMDSVTQAVSSSSLRVQALDSSILQSFAGSVAGAGMAGGGAAFANNFLGRSAADADSSKQVRAEVIDSQLRSSGAVQVKALSTSTIESMAMAVGASGAVAVSGSNTINKLEDEISASWSGGSLNGTPTTLTVQADDAATVHTLAGNMTGSGSGAVGAAIAVNEVGSAVSAGLSGVTLGAAVSTVVDAGLSGEIKSVAASGAVDGAAAVNGSFTTNALSASVKAQVQGVDQTVNGGAFTVSADNDADIFSLAGTVSGSGGAAVGAAVAVNAIGGDVTAQLSDSTLRATGAVQVLATASGTVQSVAAGMGAAGAVALTGSSTTNAITSTVLAQMDTVRLAATAASLRVQALDSSTLQSFAGSVSGSGAAGAGAALALNFLGRTADDADSSKQVRAEVVNSVLSSSGAVDVLASSTSVIESIGVAAAASGTSSFTGSNATNLLEDEISASWSGTSLNTSQTLTVAARQASRIDSLAGNFSGSAGASVGAALAVNRIGTATRSQMLGVTLADYAQSLGQWSFVAGDVLLSAESDNQINTVAVGMSAGAAGAQGSVAVSVIGAQTHATLGADGYVTDAVATDSIAVTAHSRDRIKALAGAVGLGAAGIGAAGGVLTNIITSSTTAGIDGRDTHVNALAQGSGLSVRDAGLSSKPNLMSITALSDSVLAGAEFASRTVKGLAVQATSVQQIGALTAVAGGGAVGAAGAALNVDQIGGSTRAYIESARFVNDAASAHAEQAIDVMAANHAMIASSASALAIGAVGVSGAVGTEIVERSTRAEVIDGARVYAKGAASVKALSTNAVAQVSAGAAGGAVAGVAGSGDVVLLKGDTVALVDKSTLGADSIAVVADGTNASNLVAGAASYAGGLLSAGVGLSFTVNVSGSTVRAVVNDSTLRADGAVVVDADNRTTSLSASSSAAAGGSYGVAVGASVSVMEGATEAAVTGTSTVGKRTLATGLLASAGDAPLTINLASSYDLLGTDDQSAVRLALSDLAGPVSSDTAVVTLSDGETTVNAVRQADGTYLANVSGLNDGVILAQVLVTEGGVQKVATTTLSKSTGINASDTAPVAASLPAATTRIGTLSGFSQVDARNLKAVTFVLKSATGPSANANASVVVSDGTRQVAAVLNGDGSYTADVSSLGDGVLTALVTVPGSTTPTVTPATTARVTFRKASGAASLSITADETVTLNHNAGQVGSSGGLGVGAAANVVIGKSTVDATLSAASVRVSGGLTVAAERAADIDMVTATAGGGGMAGISGAVGVLVFGEAPDSNANKELNGSGGTLSQVGTATRSDRTQGTGSGLSASEASALNSSGRYDTQAAYLGASGGHRTSATVSAQTITAGSLAVRSLDRTAVDNNAGAVALGGAAGVSAGVAVTLLGGANHAGVSSGDLTVANAVSIESGMRTPVSGKPAIESRAIAGALGFVGVGAAVSVATNATASSATLSGSMNAGGAVLVSALDQTSMLSEAVGASSGAAAVGVVVATAEQTGSVSTTLDGAFVSTGFTGLAERDASAVAYARGGVAGVVAGSGAAATASDAGSVTLSLGSGTAIDAGSGDLDLQAKSNPSARTDALGVSVAAGAAVGVSVALSEVSTEVAVSAAGPLSLSGADMLVAAVLGSGDGAVASKAVAGGGGLLLGLQGAVASTRNEGQASVSLGSVTLNATGNVGVSANDAMSASASATGVGVGFVGAGVALASAESDATVNTQVAALSGTVGGNLSVSSRGDELISADAEAGTGGVVAGAGAQATVDHGQSVSTAVSTGVGGLYVAGTTVLSADRKVRYDSQSETVNASAFGGSGAVTRASLTGSTTATLGTGSRLVGTELRVLASNDVERSQLQAASASGGGGGVIAGAGADAQTLISGTATASLGNNVSLTLGGMRPGSLELRAYNQLRGSSVGRMDLGGAVPVALVDTEIRANANANATIGQGNTILVAGEVDVNALSYVDIEANTITKTYGAAAGAQGDALAHAVVNNVVSVGSGTDIVAEGALSLLAGQDRDYWRNKSFVTARADLFNHSAIPVSVNPDADARLTLNNTLRVDSDVLRSGSNIQLGGIEGSYLVQGKGKVSDWTRDVGELMGVSSEYGSSSKSLNANSVLNGVIEAGHGNKQVLVINGNGTVDDSQTLGNIRYSIGTEDLAATGAAYLDTLYTQLKNYGDIPEVRAFVEAEIAFYLESLVREGFASLEEDPSNPGQYQIVAQESVPGTFLTVQNVRAGSGNVELFGNNVSGSAQLTARADSEILIQNDSPMNIRVKDLVIDSSGGFAKYNGVYLTQSNGADIAALNRDTKTGLSLSVDSIDTRGASTETLPTLKVINSYVPSGLRSTDPVIAVAPDGSSADLRQDELRAPEIRVNGLLYNKLGTVQLTNVGGSISVVQEDPLYQPRLDGLEIQVSAGKNFVLSSPSVSQSVGGSPESIYAVAYTDDQQRKLDTMGVVRCGTARAGVPSATSFTADCQRNGSGGIYASGGIFLGARYLNINGTIQSGQPDYTVTLSDATVGTAINAWEQQWTSNRGRFLAQGRSSLVQVAGRLPTDNEAEIHKQFANGSLTLAQRDERIAAMDARRRQPIVYYDAEDNRLKVAATNATAGLVDVVGSIINTGGGVIRALDGYARFDIDNQTGYGLDLLGLDTGGDKGMVRITDLSRPVYTGTGASRRISAYEVTTYQRDAAGVFKGITTAGRGGSVIEGKTVTSAAVNKALRPELRASFSYAPLPDSTYVWSAGYEYGQEKRYWYQKSSALWGAINLGSINWNSVDTVNKTSSAMAEGIYVATSPMDQNFSMSTKSIPAGPERQTYYRSWKKCGFLCFKKTYYVDMRTEVAVKDVFTQRVRADHPIAIELVGYDTGLVDITSKGGVRLSGNVVNDSGLVSIDSALGSIEQLSGGTSVKGNDLRFYAATGIGTQGAPVNVITGTGSFTAQSDAGNVAFQSLGGALRINEVSTTGKVWLFGDESIVGVNPAAVHVRGSSIELSAPRGDIGAIDDAGNPTTLNIQTENSAGGGITAYARGDIALKQSSGNLWVNQVATTGGDVYIETGGDLIDNNRNETRDVRTEEELLALWNAAALQGDSASQSRDRTLTNTRAQFRRYWSLRNAQVTAQDPATQAVLTYTADAYDPNAYAFAFSTLEKARLSDSGLTATQISDLEQARTQELFELHKLYGSTHYQVADALVISEVNAALEASGSVAVDARSTWTDAELKSPLPKAIFSKSSTDTQTRIEEPNVVGNRVVLRPGGKIGRDEGAVTIDLRKAGGLTLDDQLTIMSAESDDMSLDRDTWQLTVVKKDTFNVLSNRLNVVSNGFVYLGADTTDAYPNGGDANLEQVTGNGEIRIKVSGSILNASDSSAAVIKGHKAILEAASGAIGSAAKPVSLQLSGGGDASAATLVARAREGIWITQPSDIRVADVYSPGMVSLSAQGSIIDARGGERSRALEAGEANLVALGGSVGTADNPLVVKVSSSGGVNASSAAGYSVYLTGAETGLAVKKIDSGLDIILDAALGDVIGNGALSASGKVLVSADEGIELQAVTAGGAVALNAYGGDITVDGAIQAAGALDIQATGGISVRDASSGLDITLDAGSGNVDVDGDFTAVGGIDVAAGGTGNILMRSGSRFQAVSGGINLSADDVGLGELDAARAVVVVADGDITDTSDEAGTINASGLGITLNASGAIGARGRAVDVYSRERTKLVALAGGDAFLSADSADMRIAQVSAVGDAVLSARYALIDDRGVRTQAVDARNIELVAGGDIGQASLPMTVKTAADGAVRNARAGGSVYLSAPLGLLSVEQGAALAGQMALNGSVGGLQLGGTLTAAKGISLNAGTQAIAFTSQADLSNTSGTVSVQGSTVTMADGAAIDGGAGTVVMSASGDITLTGISTANTTTGAIVVSSSGGAVLDAGDSRTDLTLRSTGSAVVTAAGNVGNGALAQDDAGRYIETSAPVLNVTSRTGSVSLAQGPVASRDTIVTAVNDVEIKVQGAVVSTKIASSKGAVRVSSALSGVKLGTVTAAQDISVSAGGAISLASLTSPGSITLKAHNGGVSYTGLTATKAVSIATTRDAQSSVNTDIRGGAISAAAIDPATAIQLSAQAGDVVVGGLTATTGGIQVQADSGAVTTGAIKGVSGVDVSGKRITTTTVASTAGDVKLQALDGGVAYTSVTAKKTALLSAAQAAGSSALTDIRGGAITAAATDPATAIQLNAQAGDVVVGGLTATTGGIQVQADSGAVTTGAIKGVSGVDVSGKRITTTTVASTAGDVKLQALDGGVAYTSVTAKKTALLSAAQAAGSSALTDIRGGAISAAATDPATAIQLSAQAGDVVVGSLTATTGGIQVQAASGAVTTGAIKGVSGVDVSGKRITTTTVASTAGDVKLQALDGGVAYTSVTAKKTALLSAAQAAGSSALTDIRGGAITATATDPANAIQVTAQAGTVVLGALSATTGGIQVRSEGGALTTGTATASSSIVLYGDGDVSTAALTSSKAGITVDSLTGSVLVTGAKSVSALSASAGTGLKVNSFTVSAGDATLNAGLDLTLPLGTAYGTIDLTAGGNAVLGTLTSTRKNTVVSTTGGMSFTTLKAYNGLKLTAGGPLGTGTYAAYGLYGGTADAGLGGLTAYVARGDLFLSRLLARSTTSLRTGAGSIKVGAISYLSKSQLTATAVGGTRTLPTGY